MFDKKERKTTFVCINCGQPAPELYRKFQGGSLKIAHCPTCEGIVDRYIECDPVLICLDALLHKPQTYRHMLYNVNLKWCWKLLVILVLCDTYIKWESRLQPRPLSSSSDTIFYAALEWDFYILLSCTLFEWLVLMGTCCIASHLFLKPCPEVKARTRRQTVETLVKAITLSSFGKLFLIPAIVWGQSQSALWLQLTHVFVYTSNVSAFKVLHSSSRLRVMMAVAIAHLSPIIIQSSSHI